MNTVTITVLADNTVAVSGWLGEHGLAVWIDTGEHSLLFDTGQGAVLSHNASALRMNLDAVDTIVLSHGHYDHIGGLPDVLRVAERPVTVHAHPQALLSKYLCDKSGARLIGMTPETRTMLSGNRCRLVPSEKPTTVGTGIHTTGEIPRRHPEETITERFMHDSECRKPDPLMDDQAIYLETARGTVVVLGCAHAGLVNTLEQVRTLTGNQPIHAVIGGFHLRSASAEHLRWTLKALEAFTIDVLVPLHCTGQKTVAALCSSFPKACQPAGAGSTFIFYK